MVAEVGQRRLLRMVITLDRSQLQFSRGVRNAIGMFIPLAAGIIAGDIVAGVALAAGAMLVGFADLGASYATRARVMLLATAMVGVSTFVGTLAGDVDWLICLLMAVWGLAAGLLVAVGQAPSFVGVLATLALLLSAYFSGDVNDALERAALAMGGGLFQTLLALAVWPLRPCRPERQAVAAAYEALGTFTDQMAAGAKSADHVPTLANALDAARGFLDDAQGRALGTMPAGEAFRTLIVEADRSYLEVIVLCHVREELSPAGAGAVADALDATATAMRAIAGELAGKHLSNAEIETLRARLRAAHETLDAEDAPGPLAAQRLEALRAQIRAAVDAATGWRHGGRVGSRLRRPQRRRRTLVSHDTLAILRANLSLDSPALRHGIRLGVTLAVATALYRIIDLPRGYWVPLTIAFVMRPDFGSTFSRGAQRYAGTLIGAIVATGLTALLDPGDWTLAVLVTLFAVGIYSFLFANYLLFTTCMTALIVFFTAFDGVSEWHAVIDRVLDTVIGGALTLAAYAVWPTWEGGRVSGRIADLIEADRRYLAAILDAYVDPSRYDQEAIHGRRLEARRKRTAAEASVQTAQAEPASHRGDIDQDLTLLASLRRLADGALGLEAALEDEATRTPRPDLRTLAGDLETSLDQLAAAEREGTRAAPLPQLRAEQEGLTEPDDSIVVEETDRIVNAVNTLGHVLCERSVTVPGAPVAST
jgi:uncharacterized membrane protein YccC